MPRKPIIRSNSNFYYIKGKANGDTGFYTHHENIWFFMSRELTSLQKEFKIEIRSMVLLKNEFHIVLKTPEETIDRIMFYFMYRMTKKIQKATGRINLIFGGTYRGCLLENDSLPDLITRYIYQLPLQNGYESLFEYGWSTFVRITSFKLDKIMSTSELKWLAFPLTERERKSISWGLSRSKFQFMKDRSRGRKPIIPEILQ